MADQVTMQKALGLILGTAILFGLAMCSPVQAQDSTRELKDLRERVQRLESMNQALLQRLDSLAGTGNIDPPAPLPPPPPPGKVEEAEVKEIVNAILNQKEEEKKKADDKAKAEEKKKADAKKDEWYQVGTDLNAKAYWRNSLTFESPNKDFMLQLVGRLHWDNGWFSQTRGMPDFQDTSAMRRARIGIQGRLWETMYYTVAYDFARVPDDGVDTNFRDTYLRFEKLPFLENVQIGQMKEPLNLDWSTTSNAIPFLERGSIVDTFIPDRNTGILTYRNYADERIFLATGVFRNLSNRGGFSQGDGQYAWTSRLTTLPFWESDGRCLIHLGGGYSHRAFGDGNFPRFGAREEARIGTPRLLDTGDIKKTGDEDLFNGEIAAVFGPFSVQAEIAYANVDGPGVNPKYWGYYVMGSYFLTGENRPYSKTSGSFTTLVPYENFFLVKGDGQIHRGLGAWEVLARWSFVDLRSSEWFNPTRSDGVGGTGILQDVTVGLNWYLNPQTTLQFNYIRSWRDSDTPGRTGHVDTAAVRVRWWF